MSMHQYKREELRKLLRNNGYTLKNNKGKGSHEVWVKPGYKPFICPLSMAPPLIQRELREHNIIDNKENKK